MDRQVLRFNHQHQAGRATPVPDLLHSGSPHGHADFPEGRWPDLKVAQSLTGNILHHFQGMAAK